MGVTDDVRGLGLFDSSFLCAHKYLCLCVTGGFSDWSSDSPQTRPSLQPSAALAVWTEARAGALLSGTEPRRGVAAVVRRSPSGWRVRRGDLLVTSCQQQILALVFILQIYISSMNRKALWGNPEEPGIKTHLQGGTGNTVESVVTTETSFSCDMYVGTSSITSDQFVSNNLRVQLQQSQQAEPPVFLCVLTQSPEERYD
ncbi:unnamed protein product [Gadus morhua 'NCC']